ncbi:PTS sugar transporter subunit IIA [Fundicoccus culcitae]|uniref:Glucose PTS transporter subunit IIA n=1 Tax=Fundicoccus culcitae TaxID=2969821 RepID=A0ABY5P5F0_9LACT|nr:glucose PTS transporter subunit IIA [Fundicoccus culcitae]UUX33969.1 glucose PTS transporter subunit IIA [Fundicoccus culcitae]
MFNFFKKKEQEPVKSKEVTLYAPADGELIKIEEVNDLVFAEKMMGDGFAVKPANGTITSPVDGEVTTVFPTQHAVGLLSSSLEVLLHMGIDTVSLDGKPFTTQVKEKQKLSHNDVVSKMDLAAVKAEEKETDIVVIFTNGDEVIKSFELTKTGMVSKGEEVGKVFLK